MGDEAYYVGPTEQAGPGVLLLPSWWGLTSPVRHRADDLSREGFTVLAPDLNFGARPASEPEAEQVLGEADPNRLASMVLSSADLLATRSAGDGLGVVGIGMGGSLGLWLSVRRPDLVTAAVSLYGSQTIDFAGSVAAYRLHFAERDRFISDDDRAFLEATMRMEGLDVEVVVHHGTRHGYADPEGPTHHPSEADATWTAVTEFLRDE